MHEAIISTILERKDYSKSKRIFMLGGAPANGKSAFIRNGPVEYPKDILKIDPDEIKLMLPEYRYMLTRKEPMAAFLVHDESSDIAKKLRQCAIDDGIDLLLDGVANHSVETRMADLALLKSNGHWVRIDYVTLDTDLSLKLAEIRAAETGRVIPGSLIRNYNKELAVLIPQLIDFQLFDELYLWDTNIAVEPRLILRQICGNLKIYNRVLYENFKRKANE